MSSADVAKLAGVSRSAVSRTFTAGAYVSETTRAKVLAAADALGYRPNAIARGLIKRRTGIVGIVVGQLDNPFYAEVLEILACLLQERSLAPLLFISEPQTMDDLISTLLAYQVDGVLLPAATMSSRMAVQCQRSGTPVVLLNRYSRHENVNSVVGDNHGGGAAVGRLFLRQGYRRVAFIGGLPDTSSNMDRERGFREALAEGGVAPMALRSGNYTHEGGAAAARHILGQSPRPEGIFCANDIMAMAALEVAKSEYGLAVPNELAIVGYDNSKQASWPLYELTTVDQNVREMAEKAVALLTERMADPTLPAQHLVVPSRLVERGSSRLA